MVLANQFELKPSDVVYVDGNDLVRRSGFRNLIVPSVNAAWTGRAVSK